MQGKLIDKKSKILTIIASEEYRIIIGFFLKIYCSGNHSTVTDLARFRGLSTSRPRATLG